MKRLLYGIILSVVPLLGYSQFPGAGKKLLDPSKWSVSYSKQEVKVGDNVDVILTVSIDDSWKLYSIGDEPPHASITFVEDPSYALVGKIKEGPGVKAAYDSLLEIHARSYQKKAEFRQTIKVLTPNPDVKIEVQGQVCSSVSGQCVMVSKDLEGGQLKVTASNPIKKPDTSNPINKTTGLEKENKNNSLIDKKGGHLTTYNPTEVRKLEEEKAKLIIKNSKGKDESVEYLKDFVIKYRGK